MRWEWEDGDARCKDTAGLFWCLDARLVCRWTGLSGLVTSVRYFFRGSLTEEGNARENASRASKGQEEGQSELNTLLSCHQLPLLVFFVSHTLLLFLSVSTSTVIVVAFICNNIVASQPVYRLSSRCVRRCTTPCIHYYTDHVIHLAFLPNQIQADSPSITASNHFLNRFDFQTAQRHGMITAQSTSTSQLTSERKACAGSEDF